MLPNFLVIGAYKSGTTALHHALRRHPDVFVPAVKEPNFFAFDGVGETSNPAAAEAVRSLAAYERLFAGARGETAVGEVSPEYLANAHASEAIARRIPGARLVAVLRDPVERAYSDYLMYRRDGLERCESFDRALDEQEERQRRGELTGYYVRTGYYHEQLRRYYDRFPATNIHVLLFEDLRRDQAGALARIFRHLGVDDGFVPEVLEEHNVSGVPTNALTRTALVLRRRLKPVLRPLVGERLRVRADRLLQRNLEKPAIPPAARARLVAAYRDDVARLEDLIGRDLSSWLADPPGEPQANE